MRQRPIDQTVCVVECGVWCCILVVGTNTDACEWARKLVGSCACSIVCGRCVREQQTDKKAKGKTERGWTKVFIYGSVSPLGDRSRIRRRCRRAASSTESAFSVLVIIMPILHASCRQLSAGSFRCCRCERARLRPPCEPIAGHRRRRLPAPVKEMGLPPSGPG